MENDKNIAFMPRSDIPKSFLFLASGYEVKPHNYFPYILTKKKKKERKEENITY